MIIRHPMAAEFKAIDEFRAATINEVYGGLWTSSAIHMESKDWTTAWVALTGGQIVGLLLTSEAWVDDLWLARGNRSKGLGAELLALGESEISERLFGVGHLRVVKANHRAIAFYRHHGWQLQTEFRHETLPVDMLELTKGMKPSAAE